MSFDDLPDTWATLPLDTPGLAADVADLVVGIADREGGCLGLLLTAPDRSLAQPVVVGGVTDDADPGALAEGLRTVLETVRERGGSLVVVRGRPGRVLLADRDREWHSLLVRLCRETGVPLLGAFLATPAAVRAFPAPLGPADLAS